MEEGIVKREHYTVHITAPSPSGKATIIDVYDQADINAGPVLSVVGLSREHAIRKLMYAIVKED